MTKISHIIVFALLAGAAYSCIHDKLDISLGEVHMEEDHHRNLAVTQPIRIVADYSSFTNVPAATKTYIQQKLMPAAINYFNSLLQVSPVSSLKLSTYTTTVCSTLPVPSIYTTTGVAADLVIFVTGGTDTGTYLAWAKACLIHSTTKRPIFGQIYFNYNEIVPADDMEFENDLITTLHELTHVLGFSSSLYQFFQTPTTVATKTVNGNVVKYINTQPLTDRVRAYFNCPNLEGAYLENEGTASSAGSHFERRVFGIEFMTASAITDARMTEFTLALLEGSGWYVVDYSMAEPIYWGKGKGCAFLNTQCINKATLQANSDEFCPVLGGNGCSYHGRSGGYCGSVAPTTSATLDPENNYWGNNTAVSDSFADNCPYVRPYSNEDCQDSAYQNRAIIAGEVFGTGSMCFMGTLYPTGILKTKATFCLQYKCEQQPAGNYFLRMQFGSTTSALCTAKGSISVSGYYGKIDCPDPQQYCTTIGVKYCKRGCMGKGTCDTTTGQCTCQAGWRGIDCGIAV